ncbi:molybdate ABC transporter substrate-binding protein [Glacieibacterium frigidum]|uniref:Molybdate ABC transporter substrate-binding protein n=2 Tax=Glacieibacterium frigidum TaxID=2593303 RepID=A0A552UAL2_9SPHN|nr:molybdate ABC transporter substrate-binding protein [Glacieibacterium frigidum]
MRRATFALLLGILGAPAMAQATGPLVLAAASLQEALTAAADAYAATGQPRPVVSFAASSALARQIEADAPADLFVPADEQWMDYVAARGLLRPGTRARLLTNRLVLVAPATQPLRLRISRGFELAAALGTGRLAMADDSVPAGRYGRAALTSLGVWAAVEPKVARADNVRTALAFVRRGEARAGIVYATDAKADPGVRVVGVFPAASHSPITYPVAILGRSTNPGAVRFRAFLLSPRGQAIFAHYGFGSGRVG